MSVARRRGQPTLNLTYSMVDLLSCGMAAALVLFFIVFKVVEFERPEGGSGTPLKSAFVKVEFTLPMAQGKPLGAMPILVFAPVGKPRYHAFPHRFSTPEGGALVKNDAEYTIGGRYVIYQPSPWSDHRPNDVPRTLLFEIVDPEPGAWCFSLMVPDSLGRLVEGEEPSFSAEIVMYTGSATLSPITVTDLRVGATRPIGAGPIRLGGDDAPIAGSCS